jgi:6-phosphogluconolactonase
MAGSGRIFKMNQSKINIADNYKDLCEKVTQEILVLSNKKIATHGKFTLVLSGGTTPKGVYQCMASPSYRKKFQWEKIHFFWSDERWVDPSDPKSNFRMVSQALLTKVNIPPANIHPVPTKNEALKDSARLYEEMIRDFFKLKKGSIPRFDLILLGVGPDGHTASLFPGNPSLLVKNRLAVTTSPKSQSEQRITLSLPVLNGADRVLFIVSGEEKADIVQQVLESKNKNSFPANKVRPQKACWFLDKRAASKLPKIPKRIGIAADHGGYLLKGHLSGILRQLGYEVIDFGNDKLNPVDDYPDFVVPLARAVSGDKVDRGVAICGSGVGACIAANKVPGVRACMIHEKFSARQGVEDDDMNVICLGSRVLTQALAWELVRIFLCAHFSNSPRHIRRLAKVSTLEH